MKQVLTHGFTWMARPARKCRNLVMYVSPCRKSEWILLGAILSIVGSGYGITRIRMKFSDEILKRVADRDAVVSVMTDRI